MSFLVINICRNFCPNILASLNIPCARTTDAMDIGLLFGITPRLSHNYTPRPHKDLRCRGCHFPASLANLSPWHTCNNPLDIPEPCQLGHSTFCAPPILGLISIFLLFFCTLPPPLRKHGQGQKDNGHTGSPCLDKPVLARDAQHKETLHTENLPVPHTKHITHKHGTRTQRVGKIQHGPHVLTAHQRVRNRNPFQPCASS